MWAEIIGLNLHDFWFSNDFLTTLPKIYAAKEKIYKLDFGKSKHLHASKNTIIKVKRQPIEAEEIFDNGLTSRLYKHLQFNNIKINSPI